MLKPQTPVRLDRLSALLRAVAPRVTLMPPSQDAPACLCVYLMAGPTEQPHALIITGSGNAHAIGDTTAPCSAIVLCLYVQLEGPAATLLLREFAQPIVVSLANADAAFAHAAQLLCSEVAAPRCGQPAMLASAGDILFIGLLRHLVAHPQDTKGLFAGLADPRMAAALVAMHEHPQLPWNLNTLAEQAGMSRTAFATHFKETMTTPPGKYLEHMRLQIAQRAIQAGKGLKDAARTSGYRDASALSRALSRVLARNGGINTAN